MRKPIASGAGDLRSGAKRSQVDAAMKGHVIAQGELVRRYASPPPKRRSLQSSQRRYNQFE